MLIYQLKKPLMCATAAAIKSENIERKDVYLLDEEPCDKFALMGTPWGSKILMAAAVGSSEFSVCYGSKDEAVRQMLMDITSTLKAENVPQGGVKD